MTDVDIVLIVDRSGSMIRIKEEAENAINSFLEEQKSTEGRAFVSYARFDDKYELVFSQLALLETPRITIDPRGWTALLDAIGKTVVDYVPRTKKTIYVIMTDGLENSSKEWDTTSVKALIEEEKQHGSEFVYLGANQNAIEVAGHMGIPVASSLTFAATQEGLDGATQSVSNYVTASRSGLAYEFTDEDRQNATGLTDSE